MFMWSLCKIFSSRPIQWYIGILSLVGVRVSQEHWRINTTKDKCFSLVYQKRCYPNEGKN
jgi:hypothetical protein